MKYVIENGKKKTTISVEDLQQIRFKVIYDHQILSTKLNMKLNRLLVTLIEGKPLKFDRS